MIDGIKAWMRKHWIISTLVVLTFTIVTVGGTFRVLWCTFVDKHETCFIYDRITGQVEIPNRTGYIIRTPLIYSVHTLDTRPYQLSITANIGSSGTSSVSSRVLNAKLVSFNPKGISTFISWHGRSAGDNLTNLLEIMKCYAFDKEGGKDCPFITVLSEITPSQTPSQLGSAPVPMEQAAPVGAKQ